MRNQKLGRPQKNWFAKRESKISRVGSKKPSAVVPIRSSPRVSIRQPPTRAVIPNRQHRSPLTRISDRLPSTRVVPLNTSSRSFVNSSIPPTSLPAPTQQYDRKLPLLPRLVSKCSRVHQLIIVVVIGVFFIWFDSSMNISSQWLAGSSYSKRYEIRQAPVTAKCRRWLANHQFAFVHIGGLQRTGTTLLKEVVGFQPASYTMATPSAKRLRQLAPWALHNQSADYFRAVVTITLTPNPNPNPKP